MLMEDNKTGESMDDYMDKILKGEVFSNGDVNTDWIHTEGIFDMSDYDTDSMGLGPELDFIPFSFDKRCVIAFNESSREGCTTIWMDGEFSMVIKIPYEDFKKLV